MRAAPATFLTIPALATGGFVHGFSTLALGSMRDQAAREVFAGSLGVDPGRVATAGAVHGSRVAIVTRPGAVPATDALVTVDPSVALFATFADCCPILLYDSRRAVLALVHAGWRGSAAGIVGVSTRTMMELAGSRPEDIVAGLGPTICARCYEVGPEVAECFDARFSARSPAGGGRRTLDLRAVNRAQLEGAGVRPDAIHVHGACTRETAWLPSHRRSPDGSRFACLAALDSKT